MEGTSNTSTATGQITVRLEDPSAARAINLNTEVLISEEDWTLNFGVEGRNEIEADVRSWARNLITEGLRANGVEGFAR